MDRSFRRILDDVVERGGLRSAAPVLVVAVVLTLLAAGAVGWAAASRASSSIVLAEVPPLSIGDPSEGPALEPTPTVRVHVVGSVIHPGVYTLHEGGIVQDAILAAGGPTSDASIESINLAEAIWDGQQVWLPSTDEGSSDAPPSPGGSGGTAGSPRATGPMNINVADAALLETLPGIGPATAAKIVDDRTRNGKFRSVDELMRVSGIGEKKVEAIRDLVVAR